MNILYFADSDITINKGGVNRVTHFLSRKFMEVPGCKCYLAYLHESTILPVSHFDDKLHVSAGQAYEQIRTFINKHHITTVIVNMTIKRNIHFILPILHNLKSVAYPPLFQIFFCFHSYPGFELLGIPLHNGLHQLFQNSKRLHTLAAMLQYSIHKSPFAVFSRKYISKKYRFIHDYCDQVVVLSPLYIPLFARLAGLTSNHHICSLPNPLSLPETLDPEELLHKQKEVLIVARLSEPVKRLSLALKVWQLIEKNEQCDDWKLTIVGNGEDELYYKKLARKWGLKRIVFEGRKEPLEYYRRASIFMMTSRYEGFGMVLTESQQMGVVPIAFDSFEVIHDIIQHERNGIIIPSGNLQEFANRLIELMTNEDKRKKFALHAIEDCKRFSIDNIINKWLNLFQMN